MGLDPGALVRIQFQGWPAFQLASFPSVSVGLFEGTVTQMSPMADVSGHVRLVVAPQQDGAWEIAPFLPVGGKLQAYVSLGDVPVFKEIWRRLNSLPIPIPASEKYDVPVKPIKVEYQPTSKDSK